MVDIVKQGTDLKSEIEALRNQFLVFLKDLHSFRRQSSEMDFMFRRNGIHSDRSHHPRFPAIETDEYRLNSESRRLPVRPVNHFDHRSAPKQFNRNLNRENSSLDDNKENSHFVLPKTATSKTKTLEISAPATIKHRKLRKNKQPESNFDSALDLSLGHVDECRSAPLDRKSFHSYRGEFFLESTSVWSLDHQEVSRFQRSSPGESRQFRPPEVTLPKSSSPLSLRLETGDRLPGDCSKCSFLPSSLDAKSSTSEIGIEDLSSITPSSPIFGTLHEQVSSSNLAGVFCSTFSYPLHSTLVDHWSSPSALNSTNTNREPQRVLEDRCSAEAVTRLSPPRSETSDQRLCSGGTGSIYNSIGCPESSPGSIKTDQLRSSRICCSNDQLELPEAVQIYSRCLFCAHKMFSSKKLKRDDNEEVQSPGLVELGDPVNCFHSEGNQNTQIFPTKLKLMRWLKRQFGSTKLDTLFNQTNEEFRTTNGGRPNEGLPQHSPISTINKQSLLKSQDTTTTPSMSSNRCSSLKCSCSLKSTVLKCSRREKAVLRKNRDFFTTRHTDQVNARIPESTVTRPDQLARLDRPTVLSVRQCYRRTRTRDDEEAEFSASNDLKRSEQQLIRRKILMRKIKYFRRTYNAHNPVNVQFKTYAEL